MAVTTDRHWPTADDDADAAPVHDARTPPVNMDACRWPTHLPALHTWCVPAPLRPSDWEGPWRALARAPHLKRVTWWVGRACGARTVSQYATLVQRQWPTWGPWPPFTHLDWGFLPGASPYVVPYHRETPHLRALGHAMESSDGLLALPSAVSSHRPWPPALRTLQLRTSAWCCLSYPEALQALQALTAAPAVVDLIVSGPQMLRLRIRDLARAWWHRPWRRLHLPLDVLRGTAMETDTCIAAAIQTTSLQSALMVLQIPWRCLAVLAAATPDAPWSHLRTLSITHLDGALHGCTDPAADAPWTHLWHAWHTGLLPQWREWRDVPWNLLRQCPALRMAIAAAHAMWPGHVAFLPSTRRATREHHSDDAWDEAWPTHIPTVTEAGDADDACALWPALRSAEVLISGAADAATWCAQLTRRPSWWPGLQTLTLVTTDTGDVPIKPPRGASDAAHAIAQLRECRPTLAVRVRTITDVYLQGANRAMNGT